MFIVFLGGVVVSDPPLTAVQMLWVNLIMDTCAALALATESPSETILEEKPYKRTELIVTAVMWRNILGHAFFQAAFLVVMLFFGQTIFNIPYEQNIPFYIDGVGTNKTKHYTLIFHMFVFLQVFNEINARKLGEFEYNVFSGFFSNALFVGVIIGTVIV
jgi:P-type Ca2+ transporter type 2B